jgi:hypothetical protein
MGHELPEPQRRELLDLLQDLSADAYDNGFYAAKYEEDETNA